MSTETFTLSSGQKIPALVFHVGVSARPKLPAVETETDRNLPDTEFYSVVAKNVQAALSIGHRNFDLSQHPNTTFDFREAFKINGVQLGLKRSDIWITDKLYHDYDTLEETIDRRLNELGTEYFDLYLLRRPLNNESEDDRKLIIERSWRLLEKAHNEGKIKNIGVSDFTVQDLDFLLRIAEIKPIVLQIEFSAYLQNQTPGIVQFAKSQGILISALNATDDLFGFHQWGPLYASGTLDRLSRKYHKTHTQVSLRWVYQQGIQAVTGSLLLYRIKQALEIFDFNIDQEDMNEISTVGKEYIARFFHRDVFRKYDLQAQL